MVEALEWEELLTLIQPLAGERLLEVGSGSGRRLARLVNRGLDVLGVEADPTLAEEARRRLGRSHLVQPGSPEALPFEDNVFDLVLVGQALNLARDPAAVLAEAGRVARRRVVVEVVNPLSCLGIRRRLNNRQPAYRHWFTTWGLKNLFAQVFGQTPVVFSTLLTFPQSWLTWSKGLERSSFFRQSPFGGLIFMTVDIRYTLITDQLAAPVKLAPAGPVSGGVGAGSQSQG